MPEPTRLPLKAEKRLGRMHGSRLKVFAETLIRLFDDSVRAFGTRAADLRAPPHWPLHRLKAS